MNADDHKINSQQTKQQQMEPEAAQKITTATSINKIANHSGENKLPAPDLAVNPRTDCARR